MSKLEELTQQLAELNTTVREHLDAGDKATLDMDGLEASVKGIVDQQVALRLQESEKNRPVRKGEWVGPEGFKEQSLGRVEAAGKYHGQKISDLAFAHAFLTRAHELDSRGAKAPSEALAKLLTATTTGAGDELVPTGMAAELWEDSFLASKVVSALGVVPMPTDPFDMPLAWGAITWRKATAGEAAAAQDPATAKSTLTATEQIAEINWNYDLDEDAVIAAMPTLRAELSRSGGEQMDAFVLNADGTAAATGNINLDDDTPPTDAYYLTLGQDGIRHYYLVDKTGQSTDINTTLTDALWLAGRGRMNKYGVDPNQVIAITNVKTYLQSILGLTNVRTVDKYGPQATILTGELAKVDGMPIIVSESMALAEDDGKVSKTAANNDEGQIALVHRPSWKVGFRRQLLIEIDRDIRKRQYIMVVSFRIAVAARNRGASDTGHTAGIHGITY